MILITVIMFAAAIFGGITLVVKSPECLIVSRILVGLHSGEIMTTGRRKCFYLTMYSTYFICGVRHIDMNHSDNERGSPLLLLYELLVPVCSMRGLLPFI